MNEIFSPKRPELFKRYFKIKKVFKKGDQVNSLNNNQQVKQEY